MGRWGRSSVRLSYRAQSSDHHRGREPIRTGRIHQLASIGAVIRFAAYSSLEGDGFEPSTAADHRMTSR
jgi:hypothetical protein